MTDDAFSRVVILYAVVFFDWNSVKFREGLAIGVGGTNKAKISDFVNYAPCRTGTKQLLDDITFRASSLLLTVTKRYQYHQYSGQVTQRNVSSLAD